MMRSLFAGVSGLKSHQIKMDVIGNNIANVNTVGYKRGRVNFQDMLSQTIRGASSPQNGRGGSNPQQVGLGVTLASIDTIQTQGNLQSTGKMTDLAIQGDGFFILSNGSDNVYTRAGLFDIDTQGNLLSNSGLKVQGWQPDPVTGLIDTSMSIGGITIPKGQAMKPKVTTSISFLNNLNASAATGDSVNIQVPAYDSLGIEHNLMYKLTKNAAANRWDYVVNLPDTDPLVLNTIKVGVAVSGALETAPPNNPIAGPYPLYPNVTDPNPAPFVRPLTQTEKDNILLSANNIVFGGALANHSGTLMFTTSGDLNAATSTIGPITFTPTGANAVTINPDFSKVTQYNSESTMRLEKQDGNSAGVLSSFNIDQSGVITGVFSNGLNKNLGQIALANFNNPGGLVKEGENNYRKSNNSGEPDIGASGMGGRGLISPGSLEMSNVDLSQEFTDMIVTQRGFQANSKIITTSDEMLQELVNLKR